jgi:hypothetical protein
MIVVLDQTKAMKKILNCKAIDCPSDWEALTPGDNAYTKFCHQCFKKVLLMEDPKLRKAQAHTGTMVAGEA